MIQINLLPVRVQKRKEGARQIASVYLLTILLGLVIIGFVWKYWDDQIVAGQNELSALQQEVKKYAEFEKKLQDLTRRKELVDRKRQIITDLQKDRDAVVRMLAL